jgi:dsDNA-specific endonuclease/ATPase MutS2
VLLDEVGAGTNPLEGAALGMAILESFAESGSLLTMATTHHGELKTLKYSNSAFENACMEFDDLNLKPTYKILWGVPGLATSSSRLFNDRFVYLQNGIRVNMIHQPTFEIACQVGRMQ